MPKHRVCKSGGWHFVLAAMAAFFALTVVEPVLYSATLAEAQGVIREIKVVGNRRVEPETVRTYLKRIFFKTGTRRQAELTHLLSGIGRVAA